jgi:hypothetical protein
MKFLITWKISEDKFVPVLKMFSSMTPAQRKDAGEGVEIVCRYHDVVARSGVAILEAKDVKAAQRYALRWNPHMELSIAPVLEDEDAVSVYKSILT